MTTNEFGARLRLTSQPESTCEGQLTIYRWNFDVSAEALTSLSVAVGRAYVSDPMIMAYPQARVRDKVPASGTIRKGDFGELVAMGIYSTRMAREVPFSKLQFAKPVADSTVQGPDSLCVTVVQGEELEPVIVEAKWRADGTSSAVLGAIENSVKGITEAYCVQGWVSGVQLMHAHPDFKRVFAFTAAQHLGHLTDPDSHLPPHQRHAVAAVPEDRVTTRAIAERWGNAPPVSELHVVTIEGGEATIDCIFNTAAQLTYGDLSHGITDLVADGLKPGISGFLSPDVASAALARSPITPMHIVLESSLWYLADEDGIALARARVAAEEADPDVRGLAQLLTGALSGARLTFRGRPLQSFAMAADRVLDLADSSDALNEALKGTQGLSPEVLEAAQHVAAALIHRLDRHPQIMTQAQGATGDLVAHVVAQMRHYGRHALWPSQADALRGGLLDPGQRSLAIKMPTSAGKTLLMQLVVADTMDRHPDGAVVVVAPTRALVGQLYQDLRNNLPPAVSVQSSHGGLDYDTALPSSGGVVEGPGVLVMTPERLDLDWRRATTGDDGVNLDRVRLLVVDEAQNMNGAVRGATLERLIAKALKRGIRVVLLASQFTDTEAIAQWINGGAIESTWHPAWLERYVYIRGQLGTKPTTARMGYLWSEGAEPKPVFKLKPSERSKGAACIRERPHEVAALVNTFGRDGLVIVFTEQKRYCRKLLEAIQAQATFYGPPRRELAELADSIASNHPLEAEALRNGFGLHHGDVHPDVRQAIESAARKSGGLLKCIVCTPTLLEGVDFPARTVIAAYPPQSDGRPDVARLRNLEGRAGRAGRFTSGRLIVMTNKHDQARKWRRAMRQDLPPTETALTQALREFQARAPEQMFPANLQTIDAVTIEALAEAATVDGDLRRAVEQALERTFWFSTTPPGDSRERVLARGAKYAAHLGQRIPDSAMRAAVYRSGLEINGCLALRDILARRLDTIVATLRNEPLDRDQNTNLLLELVVACCSTVKELSDLKNIDSDSLRQVLELWIAGEDEEEISLRHKETWESVKPRHLESLLVWAVTGAIEIVAALANDPDLRDLAHKRLEPSRIRYGIFDATLCPLIREGNDRVQVARIAKEVLRDPPLFGVFSQPLAWKVTTRLEAEHKVTIEARYGGSSTDGPMLREYDTPSFGAIS